MSFSGGEGGSSCCLVIQLPNRNQHIHRVAKGCRMHSITRCVEEKEKVELL